MNISKYGCDTAAIPKDAGGVPARITAVHRELYETVSEYGYGMARLKAGPYYHRGERFPTTGDFVMIDRQQDGEDLILSTLPRRTYFARRDPSGSGQREQAVAANFDYVFILQSLDRDYNLRRMERYLTLAWQSGATPVIILTKADQLEDCSGQLVAAQKLAAGVDILAVSSLTGAGLDQLNRYLQPEQTIAFLGSSGVGKSSLINALAGEIIMATGEVREKDRRGRHTTSHRQLLMLKNGAMVIDTPGMRELGMWDVSAGKEQSFAGIEAYFGQCRFRNCSHQSEPGCAVKAAIKDHRLSAERWESYLKITKEARFTCDKNGYLNEKKQWEKDISRLNKQRSLPDYRHTACSDSFTCKACGAHVSPEDAGSSHRNHCPKCLASLHADHLPGDRASLCRGIMDAIGIWVRRGGEWAIIHRCRDCGTLRTNRIAADDDQQTLTELASRPLTHPAFPLR